MVKIMSERWGKHTAALAQDTRLKPASLRVWLIMSAHANKDGIAWPSYSTLGKTLQMGRSTVHRAIQELIQTGWLKVHAEASGKTTKYEVCLHSLTDVDNLQAKKPRGKAFEGSPKLGTGEKSDTGPKIGTGDQSLNGAATSPKLGTLTESPKGDNKCAGGRARGNRASPAQSPSDYDRVFHRWSGWQPGQPISPFKKQKLQNDQWPERSPPIGEPGCKLSLDLQEALRSAIEDCGKRQQQRLRATG